MKLFEMEGFLRGKCLPGDMKVNETNAEYLVRKFTELEQKLADSQREFRAADATIENLQMQVEKLAAENAGLKSKGRELLTEACSVYEKFNATINSEDGDFIDGQTLHEFQFVLDCETPATDAFLAEVLALLDELEAKDKRIGEQVEIIAKQEKWIKDIEATMITATDRAEAAENRIAEVESQRRMAFMACNRWADKFREAEKRVAELETSHGNLREAMAGIHNTITGGGAYTPLAAILNASKRAYEESAAAAGKGE